MGVRVVAVEADRVVLRAPLAENINHRGTLFGGSASALAILAAWSVVHLRLRETGMGHRLVIQRNTMHYDAPVTGDFEVIGRLAEPEAWERFVETLMRRGRARIAATAELAYEGAVAGRLEADFVALSA